MLLSERSQSEGLNILLLQLYDILEKKKSDGNSKKISSYQQFEVGRVGRETRMNRAKSIFRVMKPTLCSTIRINTCHYTFVKTPPNVQLRVNPNVNCGLWL